MFERSTSDARPDQQPHRCIAAGSCRAAIIENGEKQPAYTEHPHTLCDGCTAHHAAAVSRLFRDYAMLRVTIGERQTHSGDVVHSTPSPAIPIDATSDRLMTEILEWAGYAADLISSRLNITTQDGSRRLPAQIHLDDAGTITLNPGALAETTWEHTQPCETERLAAYVSVIEPNINTLAAEPVHDVQIWSQPKRCEQHTEQIRAAKRVLDIARSVKDADEIREAIDTLQAAFAEAGVCDECCGWTDEGPGGQARQDIRMSGLDILNRLTRTHHLIRQHLGHTRLRHSYAMPCPNCGSLLFRDDGTTTVYCDNDHCIKTNGKWGPSSWTEREYQLLSGMMADDERTRKLSKYLLAEAYSRLDSAQKLIDKLADDPTVDAAGAGRIILDALTGILDGHIPPADRKIATDKAAAEKRQAVEDNWAYKREPQYQKPKKKPRPQPTTNGPKYTQSSRSTLIEIDDRDIAALRLGEQRCPDCNLIHRGDCA